MIGILLGYIGTFFLEVSSSFGKRRMETHDLSLYSVGFLSSIWIFLLFLSRIVTDTSTFVFLSVSLPTFLIRLVLEIVQAHLTLETIKRADRSTFGFLRSLTLPFLLVVDMMLGYVLSLSQIIGIGLVLATVVFLRLRGGMGKGGVGIGLIMAFNAVFTISLYKYNITHFNSVEAEQSITLFFILLYLLVMALWRAKENPLKFMWKKHLLPISFASGIGGVLMSHAFLFAPASVIMAVKRAGEVLWATLIGIKYFHEDHVKLKLYSLVFVVISTMLLVL